MDKFFYSFNSLSNSTAYSIGNSFFILLIAAHIFAIIVGQMGCLLASISAGLVFYDILFVMQMYRLINKDWYKVLNLIPFNID